LWIVVAAVIGGLILLVVLITAIPLDLAWRLEIYGKPRLSLRWSWLFGLLSREIKARKRAPGKPRPRTPAKRRFHPKKIAEGIRTALDYLGIKGLMRQIIRLTGSILHSLNIREMQAEFIVGLENPADTFYIFALAEPVNRLLDNFQPYPVNIIPSFIGPVFEGYSTGKVRVYPIRLAPPVVRFIFSLPVLKVFARVISTRWRRKR